MDINKEMAYKASDIDRIIYQYLPKEEGYQKKVIEAMNYSVMAGGKRLRPMLMQETYKLFGEESTAIEPFMAAIEMIHTYSLVHDDLPAMDNDMLRRGKPTTHSKFGEAMGVLAGDALLNYAFETAFGTLDNYTPQVGKALQVLASKAGIYGMIGGQVVDVESENQYGLTKKRLDFIYVLKTGALLEASMMIGAILGGATEEEVMLVEQVASRIGVAFQIQDDILDVIGDEQVLGKPIGSDEKNKKATYVTFKGMDEAKQDVDMLTQEAISLLNKLPKQNQFLTELLLYLIQRDK